MARNKISIKTKERYRKSIRKVIKDLSRKVKINKYPIKDECPNCYFDKFTNKSTGKCKWSISEAKHLQEEWELSNPNEVKYKWFRVGRCPICKGKGYLETERNTWVDCLVTWDPDSRFSNDLSYTPAGYEGSTTVMLKTDYNNLDLFNNCLSIEVDGIVCKLSKPPATRGLGSQSLLIITAFTTDKPKLDSGEIIKDYS